MHPGSALAARLGFTNNLMDSQDLRCRDAIPTRRVQLIDYDQRLHLAVGMEQKWEWAWREPES